MRILLSLYLILMFGIMHGQDKKQDKKLENYQEALALVDLGNFEFIGRKANPTGARQIDLTTNPNYLRIAGNRVNADLPYFGRSFTGGYGSGDGGINFNTIPEDYEIKRDEKKRKITIKFQAEGEGDNYSCILTIFGPESASLNIVSNKKQTINYTGFIHEIKVK